MNPCGHPGCMGHYCRVAGWQTLLEGWLGVPLRATAEGVRGDERHYAQCVASILRMGGVMVGQEAG